LIKQVFVKSSELELTPTEQAAWGGFLAAHAFLVRQLDAELQATHSLSLSSYDVLLFLAQAPGSRMRLSELADSVLLSLSGISRLVDRLVREGLIVREQSTDDRRSNYAVLTDTGQTVLQEARTTHLAGVRQRFLSRFTEAELEQMAAFWPRLFDKSEEAATKSKDEQASS